MVFCDERGCFCDKYFIIEMKTFLEAEKAFAGGTAIALTFVMILNQ